MNWRQATRIDAHNHVRDVGAVPFSGATGKLDRCNDEALLAKADKLGIDLLCVSYPLTTDSPPPEQVHLANDVVFEAMGMSERFLGFCFLNPGYARDAMDEMERCVVDGGMVGVKLYHQYRVCDPVQRPVMERAAELGVPVLMHAGKIGDPSQQPRISNAAHFVQAAAMFPDTILIHGHIGGGGDWEWNLRHLEARPPNVYVDTGGSVADAGIVERTVASVGVDHVLFATDMSFEAGVGKVLEADLTEADREKIFALNFRDILARRRP